MLLLVRSHCENIAVDLVGSVVMNIGEASVITDTELPIVYAL